MARVPQGMTPDQLSLDDWAETLAASSEPAPTKSPQVVVAPASRGHLIAKELLETPGALLTRTHLREFGLERRAIDAVFRALPVVFLPGYSRPLIRADQYRALVDEFTYRDDRVRPIVQAS